MGDSTPICFIFAREVRPIFKPDNRLPALNRRSRSAHCTSYASASVNCGSMSDNFGTVRRSRAAVSRCRASSAILAADNGIRRFPTFR